MPIPKIIHQCWLNPPMDAQCLKWMTDLIRQNQDFTHILWTRENIHTLGFSRNRLRFENPVWNSDIIRLAAVYDFGGIYLDCDMECLGSISRLCDHNAFSVMQGDGLINNAVFGAVPKHPWIKYQLDNVEAWIPRRREWAVFLMSEAPRDDLTLIPPHWVYPFWHDTPEDQRKAHPESFLIHHWRKAWMNEANH